MFSESNVKAPFCRQWLSQEAKNVLVTRAGNLQKWDLYQSGKLNNIVFFVMHAVTRAVFLLVNCVFKNAEH